MAELFEREQSDEDIEAIRKVKHFYSSCIDAGKSSNLKFGCLTVFNFTYKLNS